VQPVTYLVIDNWTQPIAMLMLDLIVL